MDLAWDSWGPERGTPLVLGHGFSGSSHDFALQVAHLTHDRPVISFDHRGHGLSTKTKDLASYSIEQLSDDLAQLIAIAANGPVHLLGHSMGGIVSLGVALRRPDLLKSLILMDTSAWSFQPSDPAVRDMIAGFLATFDPSQGLPNLETESPETALIEAATPLMWRQRKEELQADFDPYALKGLGSQLFGSVDLSVKDRLSELRCGVTVIVGSEDHPFVDQAPELAAAIPQARLSVIDGAYHSPQLTHPDQWRSAIEQHLAAFD